uniref:Uncharacterized protein n=1 Tax=Amphimedon queenslandica TaxID=400682 RepID=A0A1X7T8D9_AMPQE
PDGPGAVSVKNDLIDMRTVVGKFEGRMEGKEGKEEGEKEKGGGHGEGEEEEEWVEE